MRRFLVHIILLFLGAVLLYLPTVWIAGLCGFQTNIKYIPGNYGHMGMRLQEADATELESGVMPSVIFLGSSHCYRTFDTRMYDTAGIKTLNLGSSIQTPKQSLALLKRYDKILGNASLVIIEVHPDIIGNSGVESTCDMLSNTRLDRPFLQMALSQQSLRVFNTMTCSLMDRWVTSITKRQKSEDSIIHVMTSGGDTSVMGDFAYVRGGFVELNNYCWRPHNLGEKKITIRDDQLDALKECVELATRDGRRCLLVEVPSTKALYNAYANHKEFEQAVLTITGPGCQYINLNDDLVLATQLDDSTCFFDEDHLNRKGVRIVNSRLLEVLDTLENLEDLETLNLNN